MTFTLVCSKKKVSYRRQIARQHEIKDIDIYFLLYFYFNSIADIFTSIAVNVSQNISKNYKHVLTVSFLLMKLPFSENRKRREADNVVVVQSSFSDHEQQIEVVQSLFPIVDRRSLFGGFNALHDLISCGSIGYL